MIRSLIKVLIPFFLFACTPLASQSNITGGVPFKTQYLTTYTDKDSNFRLYDNCNIAKKLGTRGKIDVLKEENREFFRFTLPKGNNSACGGDRKPRNNAPFFERYELKSTTSLAKGKDYILNFQTRFLEGGNNLRESFMQLHAWTKECPNGPPLRIMIERKHLLIQPRINGGYGKPIDPYFSFEDLYNQWLDFRLEFSTNNNSYYRLFINDKPISEGKMEIPACGLPHLKFGLYRAGNENNTTSVIDIDKINLDVMQ